MKKRNKLMKKHFKKTDGRENKKIEQVIASDTEEALKRAQIISGLEDVEFSNPIVIVTPNTNTDRKVRFRTTKVSGEVRVDYDYALLTTLYFGDKTLFYHQSSIDYLSGVVDEDNAIEVGYKNIVKVKTFVGYDDPKKPLLKMVNLTLSLDNGETIEIPLRNQYLFSDGSSAELLTEKEAYIIRAIKNAIRSVK